MSKDRVIIKVVIDEKKHPVFSYHFMMDKELPEMVEWDKDQINQISNNLNKFLTRELLTIQKP